jgi:hypothetical protein
VLPSQEDRGRAKEHAIPGTSLLAISTSDIAHCFEFDAVGAALAAGIRVRQDFTILGA